MLLILRKVLSQLTGREKLHLVGITFVIFCGIVLEALSISLILPLVALLTSSGDLVQNQSWIPAPIRKLGEVELLQVVLGVFLLVYIIKSIFVVASIWIQKTFTARLGVRFGVDLYDTYISQPFTFYAQTNSSSLIRKSQNSGIFIGGVLEPLLVILTDGSIAAVLIVGLLIVEPLGTTFVIVFFGLATLLLQRISKSRLVTWGKAQNICAEDQLKILQHSFGGVREITLYGSHKYFSDLYRSRISESAKIGRKYSTLNAVPRVWFEVVALSALLLVVSTMRAQGRSLSEIGITLSLYAGVAFRILPTFSRLVASFQNVAFSRGLVEEVGSDLALERICFDSETRDPLFKTSLIFHNVSFGYAGSGSLVLKKVSVEFQQGKSIGIVGPSGSGKSTFVDLLLGFLEPTDGLILVDGIDLAQIRFSWMKYVGYVPQEVFLLDDSILANVAFGEDSLSANVRRVENVISQAKLESFIDSLPNGLETSIGERGVRLSGGQRQRLGIARALYRNPEILVFDEATSSLDGVTEIELMAEIAELGRTRTTIQIAHRLETIKHCDDVYRIRDGGIELLEEKERIELFGKSHLENRK